MLSKTLSAFILSVMIFASTEVLAWTNLSYDSSRIPKKLQNASEETKFSYQFATDACKSSFLDKSFEIFDRNQTQTREMLMNLRLDHLKERIKMKGASPTLNLLLGQTGFYWGLNDCYGKDEWKKVIFILGLSASDAASNFTGLAQGTLMWIAPSSLLRGLVKFGYISRGALKLIERVGIGAISLYAGKELYHRYEMRKKQKAELNLKQNEIIQDYEELIRLIEEEKRNPESKDLAGLIELKKGIEEQAREIDLKL